MAPIPSGRYQATSPASCSGLICEDGAVVEVVLDAGVVVLEVLELVLEVLDVLDVLDVLVLDVLVLDVLGVVDVLEVVLGFVVDVLEVMLGFVVEEVEVVLGLVVEEVEVDVDVGGVLMAVRATAFHIPPTRTHKSESAVLTAIVPSGGVTSKSLSAIGPVLVFGTIPPSPL